MSEEKKHRVSRRQFLTYTLTGVGGFMAAGMLSPMVRMALDPTLEDTEETDLISIGMSEEDVTEEPQLVNFEVEIDDGWYSTEQTESAYVFRQNDEIVALSPICTHLGCTASWEGNEDFPEQFYCPCHDGRFEPDGTNVDGTPPQRPLDVYEVEIRDGMIYLGEIHERE